MGALLTALTHPIAVWRLARTMRATANAVLRAEQARYSADVAEFEATSRRLHQANTDLERDVTTLRHHVTLTREHLAMLAADAGETEKSTTPTPTVTLSPTTLITGGEATNIEHAVAEGIRRHLATQGTP